MTLPNGQPDPFAGGGKTHALKFPTPGTRYRIEVSEYPELVQAREFGTDKPKTWDDGNPVMNAVVKGIVKAGSADVGEVRSLWAQKPSALYRAIQEAQNAAGAQVTPGSLLDVAYTHDEAPKNGVGSPAKQYAVTLTPAGAFGSPVPAQPAATPAPQAAPVPAAAPVATGKQKVTAAQFAALAAAGLDVSNYEIAS